MEALGDDGDWDLSWRERKERLKAAAERSVKDAVGKETSPDSTAAEIARDNYESSDEYFA